MVKRTEVGSPINFRGFIYAPINEQGVVYLFGLVSEDLNIRVESIQQGYPDCTGIRYLGKGRWQRVGIEFEYKSSNFIQHNHDSKEVDLIVCWEDDLTPIQTENLAKDGVEIIALKDRINTDEIPNIKPSDPETISKSGEFDLEYHYKRQNVSESTKRLFEELDKEIKSINSNIWDKYSKTAITYYSPEKMFIFIRLRKTAISITVFTNNEKLSRFDNIPNHENWGRTTIHNETELLDVIPSLRTSFGIMKHAEEEGINTGWYALTPEEKMSWKSVDTEETQEEEE